MPARRPLEFYSAPLPGVDPASLTGKLVVIEGPGAVGRTTQIRLLRPWLEQQGHAVLDIGLDRSALAAGESRGAALGSLARTLFSLTDLAGRLEKEIIPALRTGFTVLTDRYIYSVMAQAIARGEDREWLERVAGFALVPHAVFYLRAPVETLARRVVTGRGRFDDWESGRDQGGRRDLHDSFVQYQARVLRALDRMAAAYHFTVIDARRPARAVFVTLEAHIARLYQGTR